MTKHTNFRIIYLNFNIIYILLALFLFYKCHFNARPLRTTDSDGHKRLYALGIVATVHALLVGYIGCSGVWFRSKAWTQIQMLLNILVIPFLVMAYIVDWTRRLVVEQNDGLCHYLIICLFTFGISLIFLGYKYMDILRKEDKVRAAADSSGAPLNVYSLSSPLNSTPMNGRIISGSFPSVFESNWNLAPFGRLNTMQNMGSLNSLNSSLPSINLMINPIQRQNKINAKESTFESNV